MEQEEPAHEATIVKDLRTTELVAREYRGTKARFYRLSGAIRLQPHLSELPPAHASVKHRHTTEAVLYIVKGNGHTVMHYDGEEEQRVDWEEGDLIGIPLWAWHQHFNDCDTDTARYLAIQDTFTDQAAGPAPDRAPSRQPGRRGVAGQFRAAASIRVASRGSVVRAAVLTAPNEFELRDLPPPTLRPDNAIVRVELCGNCGTGWADSGQSMATRLGDRGP